MLQLQSAFGVVALLAIAWGFGENRRAVSLEASRHRACCDACHRGSAAETAGGGARLRRHQRRGQCHLFRLARRLLLRVRLYRRRHAAVRSESARRGFHPRLPGAADRARDERADHAVVLLAHPSPRRARHGVAAGAHARRRRRGGPVHRRQHLSRHGGSAAVHPPLSQATDPCRAVSGDDRRHGGDRRHGAGALRDLSCAADPGCRRAFRHRLGAGRAGRDPGQPDHGAGDIRQAYRRHAGKSRRARHQHHGRHRQGHDGRPRAAAQHRRDAAGAGRAGLSRQRRSSACCRRSAAQRSRCSGCSGLSWRRCAG